MKEQNSNKFNNRPLQISNDEMLENLKNENYKLTKSLNCLKYEVKKLKQKSVASDSQEISQQEINDIKKSLLEINQQCNKMTHSIHCLKYEVKHLKENPQSSIHVNHISERAESHKKPRYMKYEIKKLKEQPLPESQESASEEIQENSYEPMLSYESDLQEIRNSLVETQNINLQLQQDNMKIKNDLKCIKYEIKKLKDTLSQNIMNSNVAVSHEKDVFEIKYSIKCLKYEVKKLKDSYSASVNYDPSQDQNKQQPKHAKYTKYEVKKLKEQPLPESHNYEEEVQERSVQPSSLNDADLQEIKNALLETKKINTQIQQDNNKFKNDIKCIKYELKKMKNAPLLIQNPEDNSDNSKLLNELHAVKIKIHKIKKQIANSNASINNDSEDLQQHISQIDNNVKCLKYEIKRLKKRPISSEAINDSIENQIKCLKYEIKKLKKQPSHNYPTDDKVIQDIKCLKYELKKLKENIKIKSEKPNVNQVFVDLPRSRAVNILFRSLPSSNALPQNDKSDNQ
ncbi:hypothetical protein M9Y10_027309 [Tritrichomonas musculus]|uniref:Lebercilin domain-containing protein n=1 Tax=Tritrichomonas musculus TaxID=1915356 RepID=A0ABR2H4E8_9EUKA